MIMRHIDRSRSTGGGMAASFGIHAALLVLLLLGIGQQTGTFEQVDELMEIAYIEAKYGEDVAAQVKMKAQPRNRPEPPAPGVNTDSAFKPKPEADPGPPRPEPKAATAPEPEPQLVQAKPMPKPKLQAAPQLQPKERPQVAMTQVKAPEIATKQPQQTLATAAQLEASAPRPQTRQIIDASKLVGTQVTATTLEAKAPAAAQRQTKTAFKPAAGGLQTKSGSVALGDDVVAGASGTRTQPGVIADAGTDLQAGGGLRQAQTGSYQSPTAALAPERGKAGGKAGGQGVLDVSGPSGGGGTKSGRKTILNYGSGSGGRGGGSLNTRQRIAEPAATNDIVATPKASNEPKQNVAEVKLDGKGVNMTISGQIQGRKILHSVPPQYSTQAKKKGWEGVVAVHFTVLADGRVKDNMYFDQTSVHRDLNKAAMAAIKQFRFAPLPSDQAAVEQWGVITIVFKLN